MTIKDLKLEGFTGTESYYRHFTGGRYTDGVWYLAQKAKAFWLIDAIFSWQIKEEVRSKPFQIWTLEVKNKKGLLEMKEDTDKPITIKQKIPYTDFPEGRIEIWLIDNVLLLPSEY